MQVKVCPKCKAENKPSNAACSSCYTSLEHVGVHESAGPPPVRTQAMPAAPRPPSAPARTQQMPPPQQTQMGTMNPPPGMPPQPGQFQMMPPTKRSSPGPMIAIIIVLVLAVFGGAFYFVATRSGLFAGSAVPTEPPEKTVLKYLEAKRYGDFAKVEPYLCRNSVDMVNKAFSGRQMQSAGFGKKDAESAYVFGVPPTAQDLKDSSIVASVLKDAEAADKGTAVVKVVVDKKEAAPAPQQLLPPGAAPPPQAAEPESKIDLSSFFGPVETEFVLVAEDGQWKIDLAESMKRGMAPGASRLRLMLGK